MNNSLINFMPFVGIAALFERKPAMLLLEHLIHAVGQNYV
jgi:hypothetical protein